MKRIKFSPTLGHLTNFCTNFFNFGKFVKIRKSFCWGNEFSIYGRNVWYAHSSDDTFIGFWQRFSGLSRWRSLITFSALLWRRWLGGRKGIRPVNIDWWGAGMVICLEWGANDLHMVQLMPLPPHHLLLHWNPDWFHLSAAGLPRLSWKRGR